jgi:signal transduction histidine kinase/ligand-binding sensor domain-containing protein
LRLFYTVQLIVMPIKQSSNKFSIFTFCILLLYGKLFGQSIKQPIRLNYLTMDRGLSDATNEFLLKDRFGFLWISSTNGLNRFDAKNVNVNKPIDHDSFSIHGINIQSPFFEDNNSDIWFTTSNSINVYRRNRGNYDKFFINFQHQDLQNVEYTAFFLEQNRWLWTRAGDSLFRFDTKSSPSSQSQFLHLLRAARFAVDTFPNGQVKLVVACYWEYNKGIEIINFDYNSQIVRKQTYFTSNEGELLPSLTVRQAIIENDTIIWLSSDHGLVAFNPQKPNLSKFYNIEPFGSVIKKILLFGDNMLLISTNKTPVIIFDKKKQKFIPLKITLKSNESIEKFMPNGANSLYIDSTNILWISVYKKGIYYTNLQNFNFTQPLSDNKKDKINIDQIIEDKNNQIYTVNSFNKPIYYFFDKGKKIIFEDAFLELSKLLTSKSGQIWCITRKGIIHEFNFQNRKLETIVKDTNYIYSDALFFDKQKLLVASNRGLLYYNIEEHKFHDLTNLNKFLSLLYKDKKANLWLVTDDDKLICYKFIGNDVLQKQKEFLLKSTVNSVISSNIDTNLLWVATVDGLVRINTNSLSDTLFTEKDGLPTNYIQAVLEDKKGNLWCSTNKGIFRYNPIAKISKKFTSRHGLSSDEYNPNAALLSSTGEMWFGGNNGVDVFHPDSIRDIGHAPQSAIVGLKIFDTYWKGETAIEVAEHITLKHNENTLTLELAAMEYTDPENNLFKVAMVAKGDSIKWVDLGTQNHVTFPNLREGKYTFMLLTANSEGIWNETPKTLVIDITPPYWRTWWFLTLIALATMSLIAYIVHLRLSKVIALQKIRLNLYENLHDDIGSRLTAIVLTVDEIRQKATVKDLKLERIGTISRNIVANMRRLVWATAPENDALSTVAQQMQTDRRVLLPSGTHFTLKMDKTLENLPIGGDKRYQMLSVFNEALTNIAKYAEATEVETRLEIADEKLIMTIVDNGKGFDPQAPRADSQMSSGHGLRNMERRANRIKGTIAITSKLGEGTSVVFSLPLKDENVWVKFLGIFSKTN